MNQKKPFNKKPLIIFSIAMIIIFALLSCAIGTGNDKTEKEETTESAAVAEQTTEQETEKQEEQTTEMESESEEPEVEVEHRTGDAFIGISDKDITELDGTFYDTVRDDVTGNWRCLVIADRIDINEYALSAWKNYAVDGTVLIIENLLTKTSTCITDIGMALDVTTYEYTDGEEHYATQMLKGEKLDHVWVYPDNGDIEKIAEE